jgi:hypothetical protein
VYTSVGLHLRLRIRYPLLLLLPRSDSIVLSTKAHLLAAVLWDMLGDSEVGAEAVWT